MAWREELWSLGLYHSSLCMYAKPKRSLGPVKACVPCARKIFYKKVMYYVMCGGCPLLLN